MLYQLPPILTSAERKFGRKGRVRRAWQAEQTNALRAEAVWLRRIQLLSAIASAPHGVRADRARAERELERLIAELGFFPAKGLAS